MSRKNRVSVVRMMMVGLVAAAPAIAADGAAGNTSTQNPSPTDQGSNAPPNNKGFFCNMAPKDKNKPKGFFCNLAPKTQDPKKPSSQQSEQKPKGFYCNMKPKNQPQNNTQQ